jgi:hypothetical protein
MKDEAAIVSGADLVEGWQREADGSWSAPLAAAPKLPLLRDGKKWTDYAYDAAAKKVTVKTGGDPRLHVFEAVVRENAVDLTGRKGVTIEGIEAVTTLAAPVVGETGNRVSVTTPAPIAAP